MIHKNILVAGVVLCIILILVTLNYKNNEFVHSERNIQNLSVSFLHKIVFENDIYRIQRASDSLIVLTGGNESFITARNLEYKRRLTLSKHFFTLYMKADTIVGTSLNDSAITIIAPGKISYKPLSYFQGQGFLSHNSFIYVSLIEKEKTSSFDKVDFKAIDLFKDTSTPKSLFSLNKLLEQDIPYPYPCFINQTQGNFFSIGKNGWGYVFYYGGYFITNVNGNTQLIKTVDRIKFKKFSDKQVIIEGQTYNNCQPEGDNFVNFSAASDNRYIYVFPALMKEKGSKSIVYLDMYDINNFNYQQTIEIVLPEKVNAVTDFTMIDNYIYFLADDRKLFAFNFNIQN